MCQGGIIVISKSIKENLGAFSFGKTTNDEVVD